VQRYLPRFYREEQCALAHMVLQGNLGNLQRKTSEPIAYLAGRPHKRVQHFVGAGGWDDESVMAELRRDVCETLADPDGVLVLAPCMSRKPRRLTESTPKGLASEAMRSEGKRVQAANAVSYRWKEESGFGLHSPARTLPVIGATTRREMGRNELRRRGCIDGAIRQHG
jgi:hypothetical protein